MLSAFPSPSSPATEWTPAKPWSLELSHAQQAAVSSQCPSSPKPWACAYLTVSFTECPLCPLCGLICSPRPGQVSEGESTVEGSIVFPGAERSCAQPRHWCPAKGHCPQAGQGEGSLPRMWGPALSQNHRGTPNPQDSGTALQPSYLYSEPE